MFFSFFLCLTRSWTCMHFLITHFWRQFLLDQLFEEDSLERRARVMFFQAGLGLHARRVGKVFLSCSPQPKATGGWLWGLCSRSFFSSCDHMVRPLPASATCLSPHSVLPLLHCGIKLDLGKLCHQLVYLFPLFWMKDLGFKFQVISLTLENAMDQSAFVFASFFLRSVAPKSSCSFPLLLLI